MGRAWRNGLTDVALGSAGIEPLRDHRGEIDPYGNELQLTEMAVVDELAGAGELVKGKCDQVPVAVVRGYPGAGRGDFRGSTALLRDAASDMFSLGTAEARAAGLRDAATLPESSSAAPSASLPETPGHRHAATPAETSGVRDAAPSSGAGGGPEPAGSVDIAAVQRAIATVAGVTGLSTTITPENGALSLTPGPDAGPAEWIRLGADAHRLRAALAAEGITSTVHTHDDGVLVSLA
jgi:coenzyme F420-0:L-glutamate ligase/coenzyme F420-1:gamma-L-glutamate ligase